MVGWLAAVNRGHRAPGRPDLARLVQSRFMAAASRCCAAVRTPGKAVLFRLNRYWTSDAWAAPYGKPTGARKRSGAFSSLNSYA